MGVATTIWKRTTPFSKFCQFVISVDEVSNKIEVCPQEAEFGVYMGLRSENDIEGTEVQTISVSFCHFHTIYQESIWVGGGE